MVDIDGKFYLGRVFDPQRKEIIDEPLLYDPNDLNTHAVVVGMTGSGKTGLCLDLLEEAALNNIPAILIDPKGDISNALLHFPDLAPRDFQPWINADQARREGKTIEFAATEAASLWKKELAHWGIDGDRVRALKNSAHFTVFTPGSNAGVSISILATLQAPEVPWQENREILQEKISGTVTALLGLVGLKDVDPVRSREHILLSNIFEHAWRAGKDLDLGELIMQVQSPPFQKLGVFDVNMFFPEKDRFELAMLLNNILASPGFQAWIEGVPLDITSLFAGPDGRPRHSVFYIAHLSDEERMFFVTLLFSAVETWMRSQTGTTTLRALLYFDEIFGYLPPGRNPPSKTPMLRMLKQARAFGVGLVLATQNPVDVDYKALSNTGTWFIGKLQTEQDIERLLDGLEGGASGHLDRGELADLISKLGKREFLLHNVHKSHPVLFQTRWAMNYLAGPITRVQIPALNALETISPVQDEGGPISSASGMTIPEAPSRPTSSLMGLGPPPKTGGITTVSEPDLEVDLPGTTTRPRVPSKVSEYFLPNNLTLSESARRDQQILSQDAKSLGILYRPVLLGNASVRFLNRKYNLDHEIQLTAIVPEPDPRGAVRWDEFITDPLKIRNLDRIPVPESRFATLEVPLSESQSIKNMQSDFVDWIYRTIEVQVRANEKLRVYAGPDISQAEFRKMCSEIAREKRDVELEKKARSFEREIDRLKDRLAREERELEMDKIDLQQRKVEEMGTHAENIFSLFSGRRRRRVSTSLSKRRMTQKAKAEVEESLDAIEDFERQIEALEKEKAEALEEINEQWTEIVEDVSEIPVHPYKKDILVNLFGVAWIPYWLVDVEGQLQEYPGYGI